MKRSVSLDKFLDCAPATNCWRYDGGDVVVCAAKGAAKNCFYLQAVVDAVSLETDGDPWRFPPDKTQGVCDWCVFTIEGLRGYFVELKGSDFEHSVAQLRSTMDYMKRTYGVVPKKAFPVLSGAHPRNSRPAKANVKMRFKMDWPNVELLERSRGDRFASDVVK